MDNPATTEKEWRRSHASRRNWAAAGWRLWSGESGSHMQWLNNTVLLTVFPSYFCSVWVEAHSVRLLLFCVFWGRWRLVWHFWEICMCVYTLHFISCLLLHSSHTVFTRLYSILLVAPDTNQFSEAENTTQPLPILSPGNLLRLTSIHIFSFSGMNPQIHQSRLYQGYSCVAHAVTTP